MVAGPGGEQQIQVRLGKRRTELLLVAVDRFARFNPLPDERAEYVELALWLRLRYLKQWGTEAPPDRYATMAERASEIGAMGVQISGANSA